MDYIDELKELVDVPETALTIVSTDTVEVAYIGTLQEVHEDTNRFTFKPKSVNTTVNGFVYESPYTRILGVSFDIDDISKVHTNTLEIVLNQ